MTNKTPFEIRTEILAMAIALVQERHAAAAKKAAIDRYLASEGKGAEASVLDLGPTTAATTEEVLAEARKLNDFVSTASNPKRG